MKKNSSGVCHKKLSIGSLPSKKGFIFVVKRIKRTEWDMLLYVSKEVTS